MPKVSVVVPVYRAASYIEKCARSLLGQTLDDLEILFIDDCTPDDSVAIIERVLKEYPSRYLQTRILKMPVNSGLAAVRRHGILNATGDYIIHCDSDDWVDASLYLQLYEKAIEESADIVVCDFVYETDRGSVLNVQPELGALPKEALAGWYGRFFHMSCANKLVRRKLCIEHDVLPWPGLDMWEDNGLMSRLFYYGGRLAQIHGVYYHYNRTNVNAMTAGYGEKQVAQMIRIAQNLTDFFSSKPDAEVFQDTVKAFQFLAKVNLITDKFGNIRKYGKTFPGAETIIPRLDPNAFSRKGRFRLRMVQFHLNWLFILMFKVYNSVRGFDK